MPAKPRNIDEYLAKQGRAERGALEALRRAIRAAAPAAQECVSYGIPAFRLDGRVLVWFAAAKTHCAFYPGAHPIEAHADALSRYDTSKGTVRFDASRPLPAGLVRKLVKARIEEFATRKPSTENARRRAAR